jgi:hypothetical protein
VTNQPQKVEDKTNADAETEREGRREGKREGGDGTRKDRSVRKYQRQRVEASWTQAHSPSL